MSQTMKNSISDIESADPRWKALYKSGGIAVLAQIGCFVTSMVVAFTLGREPATAQEYFTILQNDRLAGILRLDFTSVINVALFTISSFAIFAALQSNKRMYAGLGVVMIAVGIALGLGTHSAFSMIHLADKYAAATTEAQRVMYLTAGEATIASDWWNSTGGRFAGIFLQGGMALISFILLRSKHFSKATAWTGLLANGMDWLHVPLELILPGFAGIVLGIGGLFYVVWYPLLARDFFRLGKQA
ncbi:MAG: hypothetical protein JXB38_15865 [Anaerolineales bacterium]|nr:hypothetical protein [Anaerolineales bacterium]